MSPAGTFPGAGRDLLGWGLEALALLPCLLGFCRAPQSPHVGFSGAQDASLTQCMLSQVLAQPCLSSKPSPAASLRVCVSVCLPLSLGHLLQSGVVSRVSGLLQAHPLLCDSLHGSVKTCSWKVFSCFLATEQGLSCGRPADIT